MLFVVSELKRNGGCSLEKECGRNPSEAAIKKEALADQFEYKMYMVFHFKNQVS